MGLGRFGHITIGRNELLAMLPLALVGALCGILYFYFAKGVKVVTAPLEKHKVFLGIIGGLVLCGVGMLLPFTMFAYRLWLCRPFSNGRRDLLRGCGNSSSGWRYYAQAHCRCHAPDHLLSSGCHYPHVCRRYHRGVHSSAQAIPADD